MLPKSLNIPLQCFAELCISSQFACTEIGDNGINEKHMDFSNKRCMQEKWHQQLSKTPLDYHDRASEDGMRKNSLYDPCRDVKNGRKNE